MIDKKHIIKDDLTIKQALKKLNNAKIKTMFVISHEYKLLGSVTDGDIRRALLNGITIDENILRVVNKKARFFYRDNIDNRKIKALKDQGILLMPIITKDGKVISIVDLSTRKNILPLDAVIMAGGKGKRLLPLTRTIPKPLLKIGDKPIVEHNIDRLARFGVENIYLSINHLGEQLINYFGDGESKNIKIKYVEEKKPLGTVGALSLIDGFQNEYILIMNSDILTNIDFEDFFFSLTKHKADMIVATVPYEVNIPYGVLETDKNSIVTLREKPSYTYYCNAGIYIMKKKCVDYIPKNQYIDIPELITNLIKNKIKVIKYTMLSYWLDIGKMDDFQKAQKDFKHIQF